MSPKITLSQRIVERMTSHHSDFRIDSKVSASALPSGFVDERFLVSLSR